MGFSSRRFWALFAGLFLLLLLEGLVGVVVLRRFRSSVETFQMLQSAGIQTEQLGLALNNFSKEMKVTAQLAAAEGLAVSLPEMSATGQRARALGQANATLGSPQVESLVAKVEDLLERGEAYQKKLASGDSEGATLAYILEIEPRADALVLREFPAAERGILAQVEQEQGETEQSGRVAWTVLLASLVGSVGVGAVLARAMARTLAESQTRALLLERSNSEMRIAQTIQTRVLPPDVEIPGFSIAGVMRPAADVGGDFYDIWPTAGGGAWLGMGDVTGHGLSSGIVMLMAQSMFTVLAPRGAESASPAKMLVELNRAMYYNLHERLHEDRFMTFVLLHLSAGGRVTYAGAHLDMLVWRAASGTVEELSTDGLWLGITDDISAATSDRELTLAPGDVLLLYTDGAIEAQDAGGAMFDMARLASAFAVAAAAEAAMPALASRIVEAVRAWCPNPGDDVSVLAVKRAPAAAEIDGGAR